MRLAQAKDEFAIRYYRWALGEARREVAKKFCMVRTVTDVLAMRTIAYLDGLSPIDQVELLAALIKRFHPRAVELTGELLTPREERLIRAKDEALSSLRLPMEVEFKRLGQRPRMNRGRLATLLRQEMANLFGEHQPDQTAGFFRVLIGDWTLTTIVNCGSAPVYAQNIRAQERWSIQEAISILSWLGIAGQTSWDLARAGDEVETVRSIKGLCRHFLEAAPDLLSGLPPDVAGDGPATRS